jgi:alpha-tubulin suppressor-like RCC1 family protein
VRWGYISVALLAACYERPVADSCAMTCDASCPGDMTCVHGLCVAPGDRCEPELTTVRAGNGFACALDAQKLLWCWGSNANHQIEASDLEIVPRARQVGRDRWDDVQAGGGHACGLRDGRLFCWGKNDRGQVSDTIAGDVREPLEIDVGAPWSFVTAGYSSTCGIAGGALYCWGAGDSGQLGNGSTADEGRPRRVNDFTDWLSVSTGFARLGGSDVEDVAGQAPGLPWGHTCGISESRGVLCWGAGTNGELGDGLLADSLTPVEVALPSKPLQVAVGAYTSCAITDAAELYCWGLATNQALGDPPVVMSQIGTAANAPTPILSTTLTGWTSIASAEELACGLRGDEVWCWGTTRNGGGLGNGVWGATDWTRVATGASQISVGWNAAIDDVAYDHGDLDLACMSIAGKISCWGDNRFGQLAQGDAVMASRPHLVAGDHKWSTLAVGGSFACGIDENSRPLCWGSTLKGEANAIVTGTVMKPCVPGGPCDLGAPRELAFLPRADEISLGFGHGCARDGSTITCWGDNAKLQLGAVAATSPASIAGTWSQLAMHASHGQCAVQNNETWCWGSIFAAGAAPARVQALEGLASFEISGYFDGGLIRSFGCGRDATSQLVCAGDNFRGQYGNGLATGLSCGNLACDAGETSASCPGDCGAAPLARLGRTYRAISVAPPTEHAYPPQGVFNVSAYTCGITNAETIECWGRNFRGQMGVDPGVYPHVVAAPSPIAGLSKCTQVSASDYHACALCDGDIYCWGDHRYGGVGAGARTTVPITVPRKVDVALTGDNWAQLASGVGFTCARTQKGDAYCWGFASHGALGTGATSSPLPVAITLED